MLRKAHITLSTVCGEMEDVPCLLHGGHVVSAIIGDAELPRYLLVQMLTDGSQDGEAELSRQEALVNDAPTVTLDDLAAARADDARDLRLAEQYAAE